MFAGECVETLFLQHQPFHRLPADYVRRDDLIHVVQRNTAIPDRFGIDDHVRPVLALVQTSGLVCAYFAFKAEFGKLLLEARLQFRLAARIAAPARMSRWAYVSAYENVPLKFRHSSTLSNYLCNKPSLPLSHRDVCVFGESMSKNAALSNPSRLKPFSDGDKDLLRVVIETPKGSRNKFAFNEDDRVFELKKVLPSGMAFPYDFGFVPSTKAADGDPLDVLVLMDEPAASGCVITCRVIGVIEAEESDGKKMVRNDRVIAVEQGAHAWADVRRIEDLNQKFVHELEEFFVNYNKLSGKRFRVLAVQGAVKAMRLVKKALRK